MNRAQRRQAARESRRSGRAPAPGRGASPPPAAVARPDLQRELDAAVALHGAGNPIGASEIYQRILDAAPDHPEALNYLGVAAGEMGQVETAISLMQRSIALRPRCAAFHHNLGRVLKNAGRLAAAADAFVTAVEADEGHAEAWNDLGIVRARQLRDDDAVDAFRRAIAARPDFAEAHNNLGNVHYGRRDFAEAETSYRRAIEVRPEYARAYNNLGVTLGFLDRCIEAEAAHRHAIELRPDLSDAYNNLGGALVNQGRLADGCEAYRRGIALDPPRGAGMHSNLIFSMGLDEAVTAGEILAECRRWNERYAVPFGAAAPHTNDRDPERRLRIGYVSADFRDHAVAHFLEPLFSAHDRCAVEVHAYANLDPPDDVSARFEQLADVWVPIAGLDDAAVADRVRLHGIDILVDLSGHTAGNRLAVFARKPAPVQATWLGYGGSTGLDAMDWRITDAVVDPEGVADAQHSEKLARLPTGSLCYAPPPGAPDVARPPSAEAGHVTFASFNNLSKVTPATVSLWARVLLAAPGARMIVKGRPFAETAARSRYLDMFAAHGVGAERLDLIAQLPSRGAYLDIYGSVDIVLDAFPYNGGTTTCESLYMGVPVVTLCGERTVSRMGTGILAEAGMDALAARTEADYVATAAGLAADPDRLARLRAELRPRVQGSPLCDAAGFARAMEAAYRDMWRRWCAREGDDD